MQNNILENLGEANQLINQKLYSDLKIDKKKGFDFYFLDDEDEIDYSDLEEMRPFAILNFFGDYSNISYDINENLCNIFSNELFQEVSNDYEQFLTSYLLTCVIIYNNKFCNNNKLNYFHQINIIYNVYFLELFDYKNSLLEQYKRRFNLVDYDYYEINKKIFYWKKINKFKIYNY
jgi:hypothetical protein